MKMRRFAQYLAAFAALIMTGCNSDEMYNSDIYCYFIYDTTIHNNGLLWAVAQPGSYGQFVIVTYGVTPTTGVKYLTITNSAGKSEKVNLTTSRETRINYALGANYGLIIGRQTDGTLVAYDRQCPNCMRESGLYRYAMSFSNNGIWVKCPSCGRNYALNNSGNVADSTGRKLDQYLATYNGSYLMVHNR